MRLTPIAKERTGTEAAAATIAHELNNIAVPLRGFVDIAREIAWSGESRDADTVRQCFEEVHIGIGRISALSLELEGMAQLGSARRATRIGNCLAHLEGPGSSAQLKLVWACKPGIPVNVDLNSARWAIDSMVRIVGATTVAIDTAVPHPSKCAACEAALARGKKFTRVWTYGLRPNVLAALRDPFKRQHKLRALQRLGIAALVHCTHLAGGHLIATGGGVLGIALPMR